MNVSPSTNGTLLICPFIFSTEFFDQLVGAHSQGTGEGDDDKKRGIRMPSFEKARVVPMQVGEFSQSLLRQPMLFTEFAKAHAERL